MIAARPFVLGGAIAAALAFAGPVQAQQIKLTFADQNSPTGWGPSHALQPWVKQVEDARDQHHLASPAQRPEQLEDGQVEADGGRGQHSGAKFAAEDAPRPG